MGERRTTLPAAINQEQNDEGEKSKLTCLRKDSREKLSRKRRALTVVGPPKEGAEVVSQWKMGDLRSREGSGQSTSDRRGQCSW